MKLTKGNIDEAYKKIKSLAYKAFEKQDYNRAILELEHSAKVANLFNFIYADPDSESLIRQLSARIISSPVDTFTSKPKRYVFYDSFGWDNRGLTQQYVRAFKSLKVDFLYIYEHEDKVNSKCLAQDLKECGEHVTICKLDCSLSIVEQIRSLYERIVQYAPEKAFLHISPWAVKALCAFYALPKIEKYNINLTDHAFWLGNECFDYNIEFRNYGYSVSLEKRGFKPERLLLLPYYPIVNHNPFEGFPAEIPPDAVKIFSGGAFYKIYGEKGAYFEIVKRILTKNPQAILLFAGAGESAPLTKFIKENKFDKRFILLGNRKDINEVFKACDIYLCTYPFTGGLMAQYAAINGKPILSYSSSDFPTNYIEDIVCYNDSRTITYTDLDRFYEYSDKLCADPVFRQEEGRELKQSVISQEIFDTKVRQILDQGNTGIQGKAELAIHYERFSEKYLEVENSFQDAFKMLLLSEYRFRAFLLFPKLMFKIMPWALLKCLKRYF